MALTQIRAQINGQWYTLSWNNITKKYEAELMLVGSSTREEGGYFNVTVEATNETGAVATADGSTLPGLRLVLLETVPPEIMFLSPLTEYVTTSVMEIAANIMDADSGVNPDALRLFVDGTAADFTTTAIDGGYRLTATANLAEGRHSVTLTAGDYNGNTAQETRSFVVDTAPPFLEARENRGRLIVDNASVTITGRASDKTSPPITVQISCNGGEAETVSLYASGLFIKTAPLEVGLNEITVTATDAAGWKTTEIIPVIRLITDRTQADLDELNALVARPVDEWTERERTDFVHGRYKGAYDFSDINRVVLAQQYLAAAFAEAGYAVSLTAVAGWNDTMLYPPQQEAKYLADLAALRNVLSMPAGTPEVPVRLSASGKEATDGVNIERANNIEKILVLADTTLALADLSGWYAGEINSGEV